VIAALVLRSSPSPYGDLPISRARAEDAARAALQQRGVALTSKWRVMAVPDDGSGGPHQFVYETAGASRWRELVGLYLPKPRWMVRVATFEGDVADRAEEWRLYVDAAGDVRSVQHSLPEGRAGATLEEAAAREKALAAVKAKYQLDAAQLREVSAKPAKQKARMDWTFTFTDLTQPPAPEPRIEVGLAGDEVTSVARYIYVPEEWQRGQRAKTTRNFILQLASSVAFGGLLVAAAIAGIIAWSRGRYAPRIFVLAAAVALLASIADLANGWPSLVAVLPTTAPLPVLIVGVVAVAGIGLVLLATMIGLAIGILPVRLAPDARMPDKDAWALAICAGAFGAAAGAAAAAIRTPVWARVPSVDAAGSLIPALSVALGPITSFMTGLAVVMSAFIGIDRVSAGWTRRRPLAIALLAALGFLAGGVPAGSGLAAWAIGGAITAVALVIVYVTLLRFDPTLVPLALGTMTVIKQLGAIAQPAFPGAAPGAILAMVVLALLSWWWSRLLRRVV
jgi:hypothetical protein